MTRLPLLNLRSQPRFSPRTRLCHIGLASIYVMGSFAAAPAGRAATASEICRVDTLAVDSLWQCTIPPSVSGITTIFWAPERCSMDMEAVTPNITNIRFVLFNTKPGVVLSTFGTTNNDVMVGSPNASDDLQGSSGKNTFVVGGQSSYLLGRGDRAFLYSTTGESDWVGLSSSQAEFIYISSSLQGNPGTISLASTTPGTQPVRGSNEIAGTLTTCITPKLLWADARVTNPNIRTDLRTQTELYSKENNTPVFPRKVRARMGFPGTPILQGFDISSSSKKLIVLPAKDYLFEGRSLANQGSIDVLVAPREIRLSPTTTVIKNKILAKLIDQAIGLDKIKSEAPLIYFAQQGLLVFSQNPEALGSKRNPGRILARLLDRNGSPLKAPVGSGEVFPAKFVRFMEPSQDSPR